MTAPSKLAHIVDRTHRFDEMIDWYSRVFEARARYRDERAATAFMHGPVFARNPGGESFDPDALVALYESRGGRRRHDLSRRPAGGCGLRLRKAEPAGLTCERGRSGCVAARGRQPPRSARPTRRSGGDRG